MSAHHVHMCVPVYRHVCTCKPMSVDDRARCFLQLIFTLLFFGDIVSQLNLELTDSARLSGQQTESLLSLSPQCWHL